LRLNNIVISQSECGIEIMREILILEVVKERLIPPAE